MSKTFKKIVVVIIVIGFLLTGVISVFAQTQSQDELKQLLAELEAKRIEQERDLSITQADREKFQHKVRSIQRRISQLRTQERQALNKVQVLTSEIKETETSINKTILEIKELREKLGGNLRVIHRETERSTVDIFLGEENISDFFDNSLKLKILSTSTRELLGDITVLKVNLENEKDSLDGKRGETRKIAKTRAQQAVQEEKIRKEQEGLLRETQAKEVEQKQEISELEKQIAEIRARAFPITGVSDDIKKLTFGQAYDIAKWVQGLTGIRPAFLLSILQQESNILVRKNVGRCNIVDETSGRSKHIRTGQIFARGIAVPPLARRNDLSALFKITNELGKDTFTTPISCPIPGVGWGGAMGPAQFIPTTWLGVRDEVKTLIGRPANPWIIDDAFLASGVYLRRHGGAYKHNEFTAAMRYYSGGDWTIDDEQLYGIPVMARTKRFQRDIDLLRKSR